MCENIELYHETIWILQFINCKLSENEMKIVIFDSIGENVWSLLECLFNLLLDLLIVKERILCYSEKVFSKLFIFMFHISWLLCQVKMVLARIELHLAPNHRRVKFAQLRTIYFNFVHYFMQN